MKLLKVIIAVMLISFMGISSGNAAVTTYDGGKEYNYTQNGASITLPTQAQRNITYDGNNYDIPKIKFRSLDECYDSYSTDNWKSYFHGTLCDAGDYKIWFRVNRRGKPSTGGSDYHAYGWYIFHIAPAEMTIDSACNEFVFVYDGTDHNSFSCSASGVQGENIDYTISYSCQYTNLQNETTLTTGFGIPQVVDCGRYSIKYTITPLNTSNYSAITETVMLTVKPDNSSLVIPENLKKIGNEAFCSVSVIDAYFYNDEISIADDAFLNCIIVILHGEKGGTVEQYAKDHGYLFIEN